jgi:hypothetical protein
MMSSNYQAVIFEAPQGSEVIGGLLLPYFDNLATRELDPILKAHGLNRTDVNPDAWYSLQILMDISRELSKTVGSSGDIAIGKAFAPMLIQNYNVKSIEQFFEETVNMAVRTGLRNVPDSYGYRVDKLGHQNYRITSNLPSPNGISYGSFWEACRLLKKDGETFTVKAIRGFGNDFLVPAILEISVQ